MQPELVIKDTAELTPQEVITIMRARVAVFVVEQNCPYQEVDAKDETARHVILWQDGQLAAYTRIIPHDDGVHISFGRVLVVAQFRRQHLGRKLWRPQSPRFSGCIRDAPSRFRRRTICVSFTGHLGSLRCRRRIWRTGFRTWTWCWNRLHYLTTECLFV